MLQQMVFKTNLHGLVVGLIKKSIFIIDLALPAPPSDNEPSQFCHYALIIIFVQICGDITTPIITVGSADNCVVWCLNDQ